MSSMNEIMAEIKSLTTDQPEGVGQLMHYTCAECGALTSTSGGKPKKCAFCGAEDPFWFMGKTKDQSQYYYKQSKSPKQAVEPAKAVEQTDEQAKPKRKRTVKKVEEAPVAPKAAESTKEVGATPDFRAEREARVAAFIEKYALNELQPVKVGSAIVQTVGFTLWFNRRPVFRFHESFESAQDFAQAYNEARAEQPATRIDVCQCSNVDSPELEQCLFRGDLTASLNNGHGTIQVRRGDRVTIGAYKTKEGKLRFAVI